MAAAYDARHPWPAEAVDVVAQRWDGVHPVLEIGAGTGRLTQGLSARVPAIHAVEPSAAMVERAAVGEDAGVRWIVSTFEDASMLDGPYGLAVCAESVHWLDWTTAFTRLHALLAAGAELVVLGLLESAPGAAKPGSQPWLPAVLPIIDELSTNDEFVPYDGLAELRDRGHFEEAGHHVTAWVPAATTVADVVRRFHSMNGMSPERMGPDAHAEFDRRAIAAIAPHADPADGLIHTDIAADVRWGHPIP